MFIGTLIIEEPDEIFDPCEVVLLSLGDEDGIDPLTFFGLGESVSHSAVIPAVHVQGQSFILLRPSIG